MAVAIIPARAGSKGIPGKNVRSICGLPLYAWSVLQARHSTKIDRVIVTTDIPEILSAHRPFGAEVFERSAATATDDATTESAMIEVIEAKALHNALVVLLQPTSPCRLRTDIDCAIANFFATNADSLFSARHVEGYVWQSQLVDGFPTETMLAQRERRQPRQKRRVSHLEENGSIYVCHARNLVATGDRLHGRSVPFHQHPLCGFQLDSQDDIATLEICIRGLEIAH